MPPARAMDTVNHIAQVQTESLTSQPIKRVLTLYGITASDRLSC